jgi:integrase
MPDITIKQLRARPKGGDAWISDGAVRGSGALWARVSGTGVNFYFRYSRGKQKRAVALGSFDENGISGPTLPEARERAAQLSKLYQAGVTDLHEHLAREKEKAERARKAEDEAARSAREDAQSGTLQQLLNAYVAHLERQGKQSAGDVESIFRKHVIQAAPDLIVRKAANITMDELTDVIRRVVGNGHGRTGDKLRSYLRAAYQVAIKARSNPAAPADMGGFRLTINPLASIDAMAQFNRARDRVLSAPELGAFLRRLDAMRPGVKRDALQLVLLLGGQRPKQMLRAEPGDVDLAAATFTLKDGKGRRTQPRLHVLPLVRDAAAILERRLGELQDGEPVFSSDRRTQLRHETLSATVTGISEQMVKAKEARDPFQLRDLRRTAETQLASLKVSSDVRAQLQSHGLGGIQQRHYDKHSYSLEKKQALEKWAKHLTALKAGEKASVTAIRRGRAQHGS